VRLLHRSPPKVNEYLFEDRPAHGYERMAIQSECDVLVFGHTHKPWIHTYGQVLFVNCGSVAKPKDGDPRGAFAILEATEDGRVEASIERVAYDAAPVADHMRRDGLPDELADKLCSPSDGRERRVSERLSRAGAPARAHVAVRRHELRTELAA
jgi:hypothetical protein